jgi:ABC-type multidrug transport system fused ATPase/permease subunit
MSKAKVAAKKIYSIIDEPNTMNLYNNMAGKEKEMDVKTFKGVIEFDDVWFRYPSRKSDWVLKGLNLTI